MGIRERRKKRGLKGLIKRVIQYATIYTVISWVITVSMGIIIFIGIMGGVLGFRFGKGIEGDSIGHTGDADCQCGCIWVVETPSDVGSNGSVEVDTSTGTSTDGKPINKLKYLGTPELSVYSKADNDDGAGNFNTVATSSGADATKNITVALPKKLQDAYGVKYGDWLYIEKVGVRQLQDLCGTAGRIDLYVGDTLKEQPEFYKLSGSKLKVYFVEHGKVKKGSQEDVKKPVVVESNIEVPGYGHGTGSLTDTSIKIPVFSKNHPEATNRVIDTMIPYAYLNYKLYNLYPSTMMGQKVLESGFKFENPPKNNFFGIKADKGWVASGGSWTDHGTHEYENGNKVDIKAKFRTYNTPEEGFMNWSYFLISNPRYRGEAPSGVVNIFKAKNAREQIDGLRRNGYATDIKYVDQVIAVINSNKFDWFDNEANTIHYMKSKGLWDKYKELEGSVKSGSLQVHELANTGNLGTIQGQSGSVGNGQTGNEQGGQSGEGGYWLCNCERPCPKCSCHDGETSSDGTSDNGNSNDGGSSSSCGMPIGESGVASGLWGSTEQLKANINSLNSSNMPKNVGNLGKLKDNLNNLIGYVGKPSIKDYNFKVDRYRCSGGNLGFIFYTQTRAYGKEPYYGLSYNDGNKATFSSSACGIYSTAMVLSTLERKWINPAEVAIALQTYGVRNNTRIETTLMGGNAAAIGSGLKALLYEAGYTKTKLLNNMSKEELDKCLDAGGMLIYVTKDRGLTSSGHYVIVRERLPNGKYLMGNSTKLNDNEYSFSKLASGFKHTALYVYPKDGYNKPWEGSNIGSTGGTSSDKTEDEQRSMLLDIARKQIGKPYVYGSSGPNSFDCSGLTSYCYDKIGIQLPRVSNDQARSGIRVSKEQLKPGDLISFNPNGGRVTHIGIYSGNNKMIHAPHTGAVVREEELTKSWVKDIYGYHRYIK